MKKIALVIPYFGTLPGYFPLWLMSCRYNPEMDFLIFTDDRRPFDWPENVKTVYMTWEEMQGRIRGAFDFPAAISKPYKLCDYRPAYGEIFAGELAGYDFWGHCDLDVIWGALSDFVTEELLDRYDKLFGRGHFSLYRNCPLINGLYRTEVDGKPMYREIFQDEKSRLFDEWTGIDRIFQIRGIPIYDSPVVADIQSASYHFMVNSDREDQERPQVFFWRETEGRGRIFRYYRDQGEIVRQEFMYIHLQKRDMTAADEIDGDFLIVPNEFISGRGLAPYLDAPETEDEVAAAMIRTYYRRRLVNWQQVRKNMARRLRKAGRLWKKDGRK